MLRPETQDDERSLVLAARQAEQTTSPYREEEILSLPVVARMTKGRSNDQWRIL